MSTLQIFFEKITLDRHSSQKNINAAKAVTSDEQQRFSQKQYEKDCHF